MRIGLITDIHISAYEGKEVDFGYFLDSFIPQIDILIISGDLSSNSYLDIEKVFIPIRQRTKMPVLVVMGNHDFWDEDQKVSLDEIFEYHKHICAKYAIHYLEEDGPFETDSLAIVGFNGWYHLKDSGTNDYKLMPKRSSFGGDIYHVMKKIEGDSLQRVLDYKLDKPKTKICVTHFGFDFSSEAYSRMIANPRHKEFLTERFDYLIVGHSHQKIKQTVDGCVIINVGADYMSSPAGFHKILKLKN